MGTFLGEKNGGYEKEEKLEGNGLMTPKLNSVQNRVTFKMLEAPRISENPILNF